MRSNRRYIIFSLALLLILLVFYALWQGRNNINWRDHYREASKDPYGTMVVQELLKNYFPEDSLTVLIDSVKNSLPLIDTKSNYVFIGQAMYLDSADTQTLLQFVEAGNTAFISSQTIPYDLINYIYFDDCEDFYWDDYVIWQDSVVMLNFLHPNLKDTTGFECQFFRRGVPISFTWPYFEEGIFCEEDYTFVPLGDLNETKINFARASYGAGVFYLHTTPLALTNISLLEEKGLKYATGLFSHLSEGDIYWDQYSRVPEAVARQRNHSSQRSFAQESPLQYILSQPPLAWAWYLLLSMGILYLVFRAKRRQRIIPVLEQNKNTSLEFISTIGHLYFLQNNHRKLTLQKMKLFLNYVRDHYHLPTKELNEVFVNQLVIKSEVPKSIIDKIILMHENINNSSFVSENTLIDFHQLLDKFYKNCK